MSRWEPNSRGRLERAAMELYVERGFEQTTVAEIAERAGLTERTFFRHFADKREVLFSGSAQLQEYLVDALIKAPESLAPIDAVALALDAIAPFFEGRSENSRKRQSVIDAHPDLQERELIKMARLGDAMAGALRQRGVGELAASLAAEAGIGVFKVTFGRWIDAANKRTFAELTRETLDELRAVTAGGQGVPQDSG